MNKMFYTYIHTISALITVFHDVGCVLVNLLHCYFSATESKRTSKCDHFDPLYHY